MKVKPNPTGRTQGNPLLGIEFSQRETADAAQTAAVLAQHLGYEELRVIRTALARYSLHLDELSDWTDGENETDRREQYERTLKLLHALDLARTGKAFLPT